MIRIAKLEQQLGEFVMRIVRARSVTYFRTLHGQVSSTYPGRKKLLI